MNLREAGELGEGVLALVEVGKVGEALQGLEPVLGQRTPFRLLDVIGRKLGAGAIPAVNGLLGRIAAGKAEGGWVVIGSALGEQLARDRSGVLDRCRGCIIRADVWYAADIMAERVPGVSLLSDFQPTLTLLFPWRGDENRWLRRALGVAVHFCAKRFHGADSYLPKVQSLLSFLEPLFEERNMDAVKGIGWGLKTLGQYYPQPVADFLVHQLAEQKRQPRTLMVRKALAYLPEAQRRRLDWQKE